MPKQTMVISTISGTRKALVKGKGWLALAKINPNDKVRFIGKAKITWMPYRGDQNGSNMYAL